jgi:7,8-dihydropterin-6-yl-methyl-4-(beta-D-ribofuranosyl)aminobenzene 5'-phosphate synthase
MKCFEHSKIALLLFVAWIFIAAESGRADQQGKLTATRSHAVSITVLYDNYTLTEGLGTDWGFACVIKGTEENILFDTGTNGSLLLQNMDKLQVRAQDAGLVVISHDHSDHTGGLSLFLGRNNNVTVYLPLSASAGLIQTVESRGAQVQKPDNPLQICEGVHVAGLTIMGQVEQFLVLDTAKGLVVITGCAHPGIVEIVQEAKQMLNKDIYFVFGGFHLLDQSDSQIQGIIRQFRELGVRKVGASHCTGDRAIQLFKEAYGEDFVPIGVGRISIANACDFTDDGVVNFRDFAVFASCWRTAAGEPGWHAQADIGPPLFGDGIVDFQDLPGLVEHWLLEIGLVAHWRLDEAEGNIANDSAGDNDGTLNGNPVWQPAGGKLNGALELDGVDDYVSTPFVLNPADGSFSAFVWIKAGAEGQAIISQASGTGTGRSWLTADMEDGRLMTELRASGRQGSPLLSEFVIGDGNWHQPWPCLGRLAKISVR